MQIYPPREISKFLSKKVSDSPYKNYIFNFTFSILIIEFFLLPLRYVFAVHT